MIVDNEYGRGNRPVINVSYEDINAYIKWLNQKSKKTYRLPTHEEWEYAARAGTTSKWSFGDKESDLEKYAWYSKTTTDKGSQTIGTKKPNPWGLYDMHGNVSEFTSSHYYKKRYYNLQEPNPYIVSGGAWNYSADSTYSFSYFDWNKKSSSSDIGFRLARSLP